jgi:hypothetical protein
VPGSGRPAVGLVSAAAVTLVVIGGLTLTTGIDWFYARPLTTVAVMVATALATLIVRRLLPASWRPGGVLPVVVAAVAGYAFLRISVSAGWTEFADHDVLETFEGEVDDFPTWAFAGGAAAVVFGFMTVVGRWAARRSGDDGAA